MRPCVVIRTAVVRFPVEEQGRRDPIEPILISIVGELAQDPFIKGEIKTHRTPQGQIFIKSLGQRLHWAPPDVGQGREINRRASTSCCA